jgi:hypothetical protein
LSPEELKKDEISKKIAGVLEKFPKENFKFLNQDGNPQQPKESSPIKAEGNSPSKVESPPKREEEKKLGSLENLEKKNSKSDEVIVMEQKEDKENLEVNKVNRESSNS